MTAETKQEVAVSQSLVQAVHYDWVATLLATYAQTGVPPNAWLGRSATRIANLGMDARRLSMELWLDRHGDEPCAAAWLERVYELSVRAISRAQKMRRDEPISPRVIGHCRSIVEALKPRLTPRHVHAAIESGWTGCEMRGVRPVREVHHLLRLVREWLPETVRPPESPVAKAEW